MKRRSRTLAPLFLLPALLLLALAVACGGEETPEPTPVVPLGSGGAAQPTTDPGIAPPLVDVEDTPPPAETVEAFPQEDAILTAPFPPNVNPLTGETVTDPAVLQRRPIAVKISNAPAVVRPQSGLNAADLVFEHYAEGGVTRFTAVFYDGDASPIGSIRSGRLIDLEIPRMYDAAFAYSGSSAGVRQRIVNSTFFDRVISPDFGHGGFFRVEDPSKAFEHTLFTDTEGLRAILEERGLNTPPAFNGSMTFREQPPEGGTPASRVEVDYIATDVTWQYDDASGRWLRWTDGEAHSDANTGEQLSFANVIVLAANHVETDILEDMVAGGHYSIEIQLWGEGPASIFRDGQRFDGQWRRNGDTEMVSFYDSSGNTLPLDVGNSFVQLVPLGFDGLIVNP